MSENVTTDPSTYGGSWTPGQALSRPKQQTGDRRRLDPVGANPEPVPAAPEMPAPPPTKPDATPLVLAQRAMHDFDKPPPQSEPTPMVQQWGSVAMAVAALGGLLTRRPATASLNAMAGVMNAYKEGDAARAKQEFEKWRVAHDAAGKLADFELKSYAEALKASDPRRRLAALQAEALSFKNQAIMDAMERGDHEEALRLLTGHASATRANTLAGQKLIAAQDAITAWDTAHPEATPQERAMVHQQLLAGKDPEKDKDAAVSPDQTKLAAEQIIAGDMSAITNWGRGAQGSANLAKIRNKVAEIAKEKGLSGSDLAAAHAAFAGATAGIRTASQVGARVDIGAQELAALIPQGREASSKVVRWGVVPVDRMVQALMGATNDPELASFATANQGIANAFALVMTRGGAPTEGARQHAYELLSTVRDDRSYNAVLDRLQVEVDAVQHGTDKAKQNIIDRISGKKTEDVKPPAAPTTPKLAPDDYANAPKITNDDAGRAAYQALPPGTLFIDPNGKPHRKGGAQ